MRQFAINGKYFNDWKYCQAIIEKDSEGNTHPDRKSVA